MPLAAVGFFARISFSIVRVPILPLFAVALGAGPEEVGLVVAASAITGMIFKIPAGAIADLVGRVRLLYLGLAAFAAFPFLYLLVERYETLVLVRFLHGFGLAIYSPVVGAIVAEMGGARRAELIGWFTSVTALGSLIAPPIAGYLLELFAGSATPTIGHFQTIYAIAGSFGMVALILGALLLRPEARPAGPPRSARTAYRTMRANIAIVLADRRVRAICIVEGALSLAFGALEAFVPIYGTTVCDMTPFELGLLAGLQIGASVLTRPLLGRIADRAGKTGPATAALIVSAAALALVPWTGSFWPLTACAVAFAIGEAAFTPAAASLVADLGGRERLGASTAVFSTVLDIGFGAGPLVAGLVLGLLGAYELLFVPLALIVLAAAAWFRWALARVV